MAGTESSWADTLHFEEGSSSAGITQPPHSPHPNTAQHSAWEVRRSAQRNGGGHKPTRTRKTMGLFKQIKKFLKQDKSMPSATSMPGQPQDGSMGSAHQGHGIQVKDCSPSKTSIASETGAPFWQVPSQAVPPVAADHTTRAAALPTLSAGVHSPRQPEAHTIFMSDGMHTPRAHDSSFLLSSAPSHCGESMAALPEHHVALTSSTTLLSSSSRFSPTGPHLQSKPSHRLGMLQLNPASCPPVMSPVSPLASPGSLSSRPSALSPAVQYDGPKSGNAQLLQQARSFEHEYLTSAHRRHTVALHSVPSTRLSSCPSGPMSPSLRRGSMSSNMTTILRRHVSLKTLLNLGNYDFVPDVDVSQAQQQVDSSEEEEEEEQESASCVRTNSMGLGLGLMLNMPSQSGLEQVDRASFGSSAADGASGSYSRSVTHRLAAACHLSPKSAGSGSPMGTVFARGIGTHTVGSAFAINQQSDSMMVEDCEEAGAATAIGAPEQLQAVQSVTQETDPHRTGVHLPYNGGGYMAHAAMELEELLATNASGAILHEIWKEKESNILAVNPTLPRGMRRSIWSINHFNLHKCLHKGYASHVYSADCKTTGAKVVLKVYRLSAQCDLQRVQLYREICVHSRLQHQNIAQFYSAFLEDNCVVIVQEFAAGGDLLRYMYKSGGRLSERQAVQMVLQPFLTALQYLHTQGIIHRDIKPENCLLTEDKVLKLADFGLAVDLRTERANTRAGTLDYMAPEVLRCPTKDTPDQFKNTPTAAHYEMGADAWAVGVFAYELIVGGPPFKAEQMIDTARNIMGGRVSFPADVSDAARDFITSCLSKHPGDRPTVLEMLRHPWVTAFQRRQSVVMPGLSPLNQLSPTTSRHTVMRKASQDLRSMNSGPHPAMAHPSMFMSPPGMAVMTPPAGISPSSLPSPKVPWPSSAYPNAHPNMGVSMNMQGTPTAGHHMAGSGHHTHMSAGLPVLPVPPPPATHMIPVVREIYPSRNPQNAS